MSMEATRRLLKQYQNTAVNLRRVADEAEKRDDISPELVSSSRGRAYVYETVAHELALALREDKVVLDE